MAITLTKITQAQHQAITQGGADSKALAAKLSREIAASLIGANGRPINGNLRLHQNADGSYSVRMSQWSNKSENRAFNNFAKQLTGAAFGETARRALEQYQGLAQRTGSHSYFKLVQTAYKEQKDDGLVKTLQQGDAAHGGSEANPEDSGAVTVEMDRKLSLSSAKDSARIGAHLSSRLTAERTHPELEAVLDTIKQNPDQASLGRGGFGTAYVAQLQDGSEVVVKQFNSPPPSFNLNRFGNQDDLSVGMSTYLGHSKLTDFIEGKKRLASPTHYLVSKAKGEPEVLLDIKQARRLMKEQRAAGSMTAICHATISPKAKGESLEKLQGKLTDTEQKQIFRELLSFLRSTAERGIVHRDLSPDNIFSAKGSAEGAARTIQVIDTDLMRKHSRLGTFSQGAAGKVPYMAPKVAKGVYYGPEADLHSAGMVALSNRFPVLTDTLARCLFVRLENGRGNLHREKRDTTKYLAGNRIPNNLYAGTIVSTEYVAELKQTAKNFYDNKAFDSRKKLKATEEKVQRLIGLYGEGKTIKDGPILGRQDREIANKTAINDLSAELGIENTEAAADAKLRSVRAQLNNDPSRIATFERELSSFLQEMDDSSTITHAALSLIHNVNKSDPDWITGNSRVKVLNLITATEADHAISGS